MAFMMTAHHQRREEWRVAHEYGSFRRGVYPCVNQKSTSLLSQEHHDCIPSARVPDFTVNKSSCHEI